VCETKILIHKKKKKTGKITVEFLKEDSELRRSQHFPNYCSNNNTNTINTIFLPCVSKDFNNTATFSRSCQLSLSHDSGPPPGEETCTYRMSSNITSTVQLRALGIISSRKVLMNMARSATVSEENDNGHSIEFVIFTLFPFHFR
jgi:hypothetical protein